MEMIVIEECCLPLEAAEVISRCVNREDYQETKNKFLMRYGARFDAAAKKAFINKMKVIEEIYDRVREKIPQDSMTEFLFRKHYYGNTYAVLAQVMLINFQSVGICSVPEYLEACKVRWKKQLRKKVHLKAVAFSALVWEEVPEGGMWKEHLLEDIDSLDYPYEFKWGLLKVLTNYEYYIAQLERIFHHIEAELREALKLLDPAAEKMKRFWEKKLNQKALEEMAGGMGLPMEDIRGKKVLLQLTRMSCDQAIMDEQWDKKKLPLYLGICVEWASQFEDTQIDRSLLCEKLRVISEDSKFEILQRLHNKSSYGQEIARELNLDAATVSRHLTVLQRHGLIYIERKEGRNIYYTTNQSEIRNILGLMQEIFLA